MNRITRIVAGLMVTSAIMVPYGVGAQEPESAEADRKTMWTISISSDEGGGVIASTPASNAPVVDVIARFVGDLDPPCDAAVFCTAVIHACITACIADSGGQWAYATCKVTEDECFATCECSR